MARAEPHWLNRKHAAASCGVSVQAFDRWGVVPVAKLGREVFFTIEAIVQNRIEAQPAHRTEESNEDLERERLLLIREQREGQALKNAQMRRELAPVAAIEWVLGRLGGQISGILESIPLKVKRLVPALTATEVDHIKREIVKAQNAAARTTVDLDEYYAGQDG